MGKRKRSGSVKGKKRGMKKPRRGYTTVARTRGVYAQGEMKYYDTGVSLTAITASTDWTGTEIDPTTLNTLFVPVLGTGIANRIGKEVKVHKLKMRLAINSDKQIDQTACDAGSLCRVILYQDTQTNATQAQGEDVMETGASALLSLLNFQNINNFGRFKLLKEKYISVQNPNVSYDGTNLEQCGLIYHWKWNITFKKPLSIRFNATNGGSVADIVDHSFHIIAITSSTALAPTLSYRVRTCFKE